MTTFNDFNISKQLKNALIDLGFDTPTPIQKEAFPIILSGKDIVGIAQTGTGKTLGYMLPILQELKFSKQLTPRVLIIVPTRELVLQVVEQVESFAKYINTRVLGVYGGTNINTQKMAVAQGCDILVATPGRLYDLVANNALQLKAIKKFVIDEVDVMLDLGFRHQITNILDLLPEKRQNIMFSATMTDEVDTMINESFTVPTKISIAVSGTPLENINQTCYPVPNFNTKVNLLDDILSDKDTFSKVLVFVDNKKIADRLFEDFGYSYTSESCIIHSNKSQNYRINSIQEFDQGVKRILIATDVMARGLDLNQITHVINFDTPAFPENYMHRIGRTGRAEREGKSILFYTEKEIPFKNEIEKLMGYEIPKIDFPEYVDVSNELIPEETKKSGASTRKKKEDTSGPSFHEKSLKNQKVNLGSSHKRMIKEKYKKPQARGDKFAAKNRKKR